MRALARAAINCTSTAATLSDELKSSPADVQNTWGVTATAPVAAMACATRSESCRVPKTDRTGASTSAANFARQGATSVHCKANATSRIASVAAGRNSAGVRAMPNATSNQPVGQKKRPQLRNQVMTVDAITWGGVYEAIR